MRWGSSRLSEVGQVLKNLGSSEYAMHPRLVVQVPRVAVVLVVLDGLLVQVDDNAYLLSAALLFKSNFRRKELCREVHRQFGLILCPSHYEESYSERLLNS